MQRGCLRSLTVTRRLLIARITTTTSCQKIVDLLVLILFLVIPHILVVLPLRIIVHPCLLTNLEVRDNTTDLLFIAKNAPVRMGAAINAYQGISNVNIQTQFGRKARSLRSLRRAIGQKHVLQGHQVHQPPLVMYLRRSVKGISKRFWHAGAGTKLLQRQTE